MMRSSLLLLVTILIFPKLGQGQCAPSEIELKVAIATDNWGYETYWQITNLLGDTLLTGGANGVYDNNSNYTDSICVAADGCYFFEIFDSYGDGIYAPNGYTLYVNDDSVASGANDIGSYANITFSCPNPCNLTWTSLVELDQHLNGSILLSGEELLQIQNVFDQFPSCLAESEDMIELAKSVIDNFDEIVGPLFTTPNTQNGFSKNPDNAPGLELERAILALEQGVFDEVFTSEIYAAYPNIIQTWVFQSCNSFPGYMAPPMDSLNAFTIPIRANFADPAGMNPYFNINGYGTEHALRPTGWYLAPGTVATVTVPDSLVSSDYFVQVGAHEWDLGIRPIFKRLDRISKRFPIESNTIEVFNPFGGAIAIAVPYGADDGVLEVSANNIHEAPFFSIKPFYETLDFNEELNKPGIWAVFETDNVMYTIPSHSIVPGQYDLKQTMLDWDAALQGVNSVMAREIIPDKHNMYMIADITIRHNVYSIGYPMSNSPLNFNNVPGPTYFIDGPGPNDEVNFHESGHALAMSKFPGEVEALVNVPYIMAMHHGLGVELNEAVNYSFVPNTFDIDKTATHRMVSNTFGGERIIINSTTNEVRYQHRGYGHYFEIVHMFDWCPLRNFWRQEYIDFQNGIDHGINNQDIDSRILRMSVAAQADLRPLFHVFGILPQDTETLQNNLNQAGIEPSPAIYNRLQEYFELIPADNEAFVEYALFVYPNLYANGPSANPDYGVGWHYQKSLTYDAAEAQERTAILQSIIELYFPSGAPIGFDADVCCTLDTLELDWMDEELFIEGGVEPYSISIDTTNNIQTIQVVDFDGCTSSIQNIINNLSELEEKTITIFPNPNSGAIQIDLSSLAGYIDLSILNTNGTVVYNQKVQGGRIIPLSFNYPDGVYLLKLIQGAGSMETIKLIKQ